MFRGNVTTVTYGLLPIHNSGAESICFLLMKRMQCILSRNSRQVWSIEKFGSANMWSFAAEKQKMHRIEERKAQKNTRKRRDS